MDADWDAIVVGSGLGGLTAGAYLAANGMRTAVLEQHYVAGGNSHVFRRKRFEFDVGVHYVGDCGPTGSIPTILRGVGLEIEFLEMDPDGFDTLVFPGLTFRVPKGWDRYRDRLIETLPEDEAGLRMCVDVLRGVAAEMGRVRLPVPAEDVPRLLQEAPTLIRWGLRPLAELFDECALSDRARALLAAESGDYGSPPSRAPVLMQAGLTDHYMKGAFYPRGGGQVFAAHLADAVRANGGALFTSARVERILVEGGRAAGVRMADGRELRAPVVVSNADLKRTFLQMIGEEHLSGEAVGRVRGYRMALPAFCVYLGLDIDLRGRVPNTNYWMADTFDVERLYAECYEGRVPDEVFAFVTAASVKDPYTETIAPRGCSNVQVITIVPPGYEVWGLAQGPAAGERYRRNPEYRGIKERLTDRLVEAAERVLPEIKGHIVWKEAATPITQERFTLSTGGTSYGIELACDQFGPNRPSPKTEIPGLYLAGASTVYAHGIGGVMRGGIGCAGAILGRNLMTEVQAGQAFGDPSRLTGGGPGWDPLRASRGVPWRRAVRDLGAEAERVPARG